MSGRRKSIRLEGYDYSQEGLYFVTIDLESKKNLFWKGENIYVLNEIGKLVEKCWLDLEMKFKIRLDEYVIMPNHLHGIIQINRATTRVARTLNSDVGAGFMPAQNIKIMPAQNNLGNMVGAFKSVFVWEYINNVKNQNWPRFFKRLWQRNYYERIIRNKKRIFND